MSQYFIQDPTRTAKGTQQDYVATFEDVPSFMNYLNEFCVRKFGQDRATFIQEQSDLQGYSENTDAGFYDMIKAHRIRMGVVRNGALIECDVLRENKYSSGRSEYGD